MGFSRTQYWVCGAAFKLRGLLMAPPLAFTFLHYDARFEDSAGAWIVGVIVFASALGLRIAAQKHLRYRMHVRHRLATTGPYRSVRNPVYLANLLMFVGLALMSELPWMGPVLFAWGGLVYSLAIRFEEARLQKRYGYEYEAYKARTPRWLPRFVRPGSVVPCDGPAWLRSFAVELHCLALGVFPLVKELLEGRAAVWAS